MIAAVADPDPLEAAIAVEETVIGDGDLGVLILDEAAVQVKPHENRPARPRQAGVMLSDNGTIELE